MGEKHPEAKARAEPDYIYDPDNWECSSDWADRNSLADTATVWQMMISILSAEKIKRVGTLLKGPDKFAAKLGIGKPDEEGWFDNYEICWFDSEEEAAEAIRQRGQQS